MANDTSGMSVKQLQEKLAKIESEYDRMARLVLIHDKKIAVLGADYERRVIAATEAEMEMEVDMYA